MYFWPIEYVSRMPTKIKKARYSDEPVFVNSEGVMEPYIPPEIITNRDAYGASLHLLFKHTADFHMLMIEILAEKTGLDATEIVQVIQNDQRYKDIIVNPTITSMSLVTKKDIEKHVTLEAPVQQKMDSDVEGLGRQVGALLLSPEAAMIVDMLAQPVTDVAIKKLRKVAVKKKAVAEAETTQ